MSSEIVINSTPREIRVALLENNLLVELFIEHKAKKGIVGNVYKGVVNKVLPGVEIGADCTLGSGAVATVSLSPGTTATGVPARAVLRTES